jgi:hypothetical protein
VLQFSHCFKTNLWIARKSSRCSDLQLSQELTRFKKTGNKRSLFHSRIRQKRKFGSIYVLEIMSQQLGSSKFVRIENFYRFSLMFERGFSRRTSRFENPVDTQEASRRRCMRSVYSLVIQLKYGGQLRFCNNANFLAISNRGQKFIDDTRFRWCLSLKTWMYLHAIRALKLSS